jgi:hypothetical protein
LTLGRRCSQPLNRTLFPRFLLSKEMATMDCSNTKEHLMSLPKMSKSESRKVTAWLDTTELGALRWGPRRRKAAPSGAGRADRTPEHEQATRQEVAVLPLSAIQDDVQTFPADPQAVSEQKTAISIGGQTLLVTVRKHDDGRLEQLDGFHCTTALRELGRSEHEQR